MDWHPRLQCKSRPRERGDPRGSSPVRCPLTGDIDHDDRQSPEGRRSRIHGAQPRHGRSSVAGALHDFVYRHGLHASTRRESIVSPPPPLTDCAISFVLLETRIGPQGSRRGKSRTSSEYFMVATTGHGMFSRRGQFLVRKIPMLASPRS